MELCHLELELSGYTVTTIHRLHCYSVAATHNKLTMMTTPMKKMKCPMKRKAMVKNSLPL